MKLLASIFFFMPLLSMGQISFFNMPNPDMLGGVAMHMLNSTVTKL